MGEPYANHFLKILKSIVEKGIGHLDWFMISINPNITLDIVKNNRNLPWDRHGISMNQNITWDVYINNPDFYWDIDVLTSNPSMSDEIVQRYFQGFNPPLIKEEKHLREIMDGHWDCDFQGASSSKITPEIIEKYWDRLNWFFVSQNEYVSVEFIISNRDRYPWVEFYLFQNPNITWDVIEKHPEGILGNYTDESWRGFSYNKNLTWGVVKNHPEIPWAWSGVSKNENITWEIISQNLSYPWEWNSVSAKSDLSPEFVIDHPDDFPWDYEGLLGNPNMTVEIFEKISGKITEPDLEDFENNKFGLSNESYCYFISKRLIKEEIDTMTEFGIIPELAKMITDYYDTVI
jgi:hypothetical protein